MSPLLPAVRPTSWLSVRLIIGRPKSSWFGIPSKVLLSFRLLNPSIRSLADLHLDALWPFCNRLALQDYRRIAVNLCSARFA